MQGGEQDILKFFFPFDPYVLSYSMSLPRRSPAGLPTLNTKNRKIDYLGQREHEWVPPTSCSAGSECLSSPSTRDRAPDCWALSKGHRSCKCQADNLLLRGPFKSSFLIPHSLREVISRYFVWKFGHGSEDFLCRKESRNSEVWGDPCVRKCKWMCFCILTEQAARAQSLGQCLWSCKEYNLCHLSS